MTRPHIVRADTLDLQDHSQPSAQTHPHARQYVSGANNTPTGPHQTAELRHVHDERHAEQEHLADHFGSGRSSHEGSELLEEDPEFLLSNGPDPHDPRHDEAALQQNGGLQVTTGDPDGGLMDPDPDDDLDDEDDDEMDKISSSPSIGDEDIDFEFVYALHTFVATVEGQANATKGDTMVLLDDSNSYWWLVRVVKDSSIGYLPAEHIETPTERLARLNKHRNIDLAQTMLGDTPERSKNPLKKAIRRRNARMVQFAPPTYFEAAEVDWSDEEGEAEGEVDDIVREGSGDGEQSAQEADQAETDAIVAEDHQEAHRTEDDITPVHSQEPGQADAVAATAATAPAAKDKADADRKSEDIADESGRNARSRNGTIRNTDSFFKDETAEPRKISLTPNLLREEAKANGSPDKANMATFFDELDKSTTAEKTKDSKSKKDKKPEKDKKSGVLSGLFKRKDKKIKVDEAAGGTVSKQDSDIPVSPSTATMASTETSSATSPTSASFPAPLQTRKGGKLTKAPPAQAPLQQAQIAVQQPADAATAGPTNAKAQPLSLQIPEEESIKNKGSVLSPLTNFMGSSNNDQPKKEKLKKAKNRIELDVDSSPENELADEYDPVTRQLRKPGFPTPVQSNPPTTISGRTHQNEQMPYGHGGPRSQTRNVDNSSQSTATYGDSVDLQERSTAATTPADQDHGSWDGAALRAYLDSRSTSDIKEMMLLITDPAHSVQVHERHPLMTELGFQDHQRKLNDLSSQLDGLLNSFLTKKKMMPQVHPVR